MITLKTLPSATAQEVFDQVVANSLRQGKKSLRPGSNSSCQYRGGEDGGLRCNAGWLISDDEYREELEDKAWDNLVDEGWVPQEHKKLIIGLQLIHDGYSPEKWRDMYEGFAIALGLEMRIQSYENQEEE